MKQDILFALRSFAKRPGFVLVAVLSLGLGIGLNASVFTWFKAVYLDPLPGVKDARSLVTVNASFRDGAGLSNSYTDYLYIRDQSGVFDGLFAHETETFAFGYRENAELTEGGIVSGNYFDVLAVKMIRGRSFRVEEDEVSGRDPVIVLSHSLWQRRFGGDDGIIGRNIELNRTSFTVIGVAQPGFSGVYGGIRQDFWVPLHMTAALDASHRDHEARGGWLQITGRPKDGISLSTIQAALDTVSNRIRSDYRKDRPDYRAEAFPLHRSRRGFHSSLFDVVRPLGFGVGIILLLACSNVAGLLVARVTERSREVCIRLSLGASRGRIVRQLFTESLVLGAAGGAIGLLLAVWTRSLPDYLLAGGPDVVLNTSIDWRVIAFLFAVSVAAAIVFGLLPTMETTRVNLSQALKESGNASAGSRRNRWRSSLVVVQVALSVANLAGALLVGQHMYRMVHADRGFRSENVFTAHADLLAAGIDESRGRRFYQDSIAQVRGLPQAESAAWTTFLPMSGTGGGNRRSVEVAGFAAGGVAPLSVIVDSVTPRFLQTLGIPLSRGREFQWTDAHGAAPVLIVNEKFVDQYLSGRDPIGARVRLGNEWRTIVGVHRNYVYRHPGSPARPSILLPLAQDYDPRAVLVMRTGAGPAQTAAALRDVIRGFDRHLFPSRMMTMEENVARQFAEVRIVTGVLGVLGMIASTLAAIGLYGALAAFVGQRRRELGIRLSVGATPEQLRRMVLMQSARLTLTGVACGLLLSLALGQALRSSIAGVDSFNPLVYAGAALGACFVSFVSTSIPSRRAARTDPILALRPE